MRILFYIARGYGIPVIKPIVAYLKQYRPHYTFAFYTSTEVHNNFPDAWRRDQVLMNLSAVKSFNPEAVLCTGNYVDFRIPGIKVQLFHGVGIEKASHYKIRHFFDLYCTSGPWVTEVFKRNARRYRYFEVTETGWPKFDYILRYKNAKQSDQTRHRNGSKQKPTILYAPTFSRRLHSAQELLSSLPNVMKPHERWVIKYHELMDPKWVNACKAIQGHSVVIAKHDQDITPLLWEADLMISDTSSVIYEFLALGKPVITYNTLGSDQKGYPITHPNMLREAIDTVLKNPDYYAKRGGKVLNNVNPYLDGLCSQRVIEAVENVLIQGKHNRKKPWNLIRKAQVLWHYYFKRGYLD